MTIAKTIKVVKKLTKVKDAVMIIWYKFIIEKTKKMAKKAKYKKSRVYSGIVIIFKFIILNL